MRIREYEIIKGPFSGTYGKVSIGKHTTLGIKRAIKELHSHVKPELIREEARKQELVKSPYVVQIHDFFDDPPAILMEYCPTGLDQYLRDNFRQLGGRIPYDEARKLLHGILQGLNDAHKAGLVHGDIKPANVRFGTGETEGELGLPKLADFGAARNLREAGLLIKGSTNWMAPELIAGGEATQESDYFSFGILAYLVLTARHPYFANDPSCLLSEDNNIASPTFTVEPLNKVRNDVPLAVCDLIMELLSRNASARMRAEQDLKAALAQPMEAETILPSAMTTAAPTTTAALTVEPTLEETKMLDEAYERARQSFFSFFRPKDAVDIINATMEQIRWERFVGAKVTRLADCWSLRAFINNSASRFPDAVTAATNGLQVDNNHVNSLHSRGYAYIQQGDYPAAKRDLDRALELAETPTKRQQISSLLDTLKSRT